MNERREAALARVDIRAESDRVVVAVARKVDILVTVLVQLKALTVEFGLYVERATFELFFDLDRFGFFTLKRKIQK